MIYVNIGGCDSRHFTGFGIDNLHGNRDYLIIIAKTNAIFEIQGVQYETLPGTFVLIDKNIPYRYWNNYGEYVNDWAHFDIIDEKLSFPDLSIPFNTPIYLNNLSAITLLMNQIIKELYSESSQKDDIINHFMHILFLRLSNQIITKEDPIKSHPFYIQTSALRATMYSTPEKKWTIEEMSAELNMSQSYFMHLYKKMFQISCINDMINARIEAAKFRLSSSDMPINVISELCGYENLAHFCRQFKKNTGLTPREYRYKLTADN